jgi:hypothetical protein
MGAAMSSLSQELAEPSRLPAGTWFGSKGRRRGPSSGIVWGAEGLVVTTHHVLERDEGIGVGLPGRNGHDRQGRRT